MSTEPSTRGPLELAALILRRNAMIGLVGLCGLAAWLAPWLGAAEGPLHPRVTTKAAVALIFFLQGLLLPLEAIRSGLRAWKLHAVTQGSIFLLAPALAGLMTTLAGERLTPDLRMGLLFLGILPTTVATAAALTAQVGGNVAGALFNTCLANIAGIVIVPAVVAWLAVGERADMALLPLMKNIAIQLLLPLLVGQALRPLGGRWAELRRAGIRRGNSALILFMLWAALCDAVQDRVWRTGGLEMVLWAAMGAAALLAILTLLTAMGSRAVGLDRDDRVAAVFCGSQKTLAAGVPLAQTLFGAMGGVVGVIVLPLVFYHAFQLTLGVILASRWERAQGARPPG